MPTLAVFRGDALVQFIELDGRDLRVGRSPDNDLVLKDDGKAVSRFHAELRAESQDVYAVIDLNSQNGTWIDGERITRARLEPGKDIAIGPYRLMVQDVAPEAQSKAMASESSTSGTQHFHASRVPLATTASVMPRRAAGAGERDPIAWLARQPKPLVVGGFLTLLLVIGLLMPRAGRSDVAANASPAVPEATPAARASTPNGEAIADHLTQARAFISKNEFEVAIRDHLDRVLQLEPRHSEASELRARAMDEAARMKAMAKNAEMPKAATAVTAPPPPPVKKRLEPTPPDPNQLPRNAGENELDWQARNAQVLLDYRRALERHEAQDWPAAVQAWSDIVALYPGYRDASARLGEARAGLRETARAAVDVAKGLEAKGDLLEALAQYERANQLGNGEAADAIIAVRARMKALGQESFKLARQFHNYGRVPEAKAHYERAVRYLPAVDPNRQIAVEQLQKLKLIAP